MGSFLMNCFVSQQVLPEGAKAVVIPIKKQMSYDPCSVSRGKETKSVFGEYSSICYNNSFWSPLGVKIDVLADDYGRQNLVDTPFNRISLMIFFEQILNDTFSTEQGENEYHDLAFNPQALFEEKSPKIHTYITKNKFFKISHKEAKSIPWDEFEELWSKIQELTSENRIFIRDYQGRPCQLQMSLCLKDSYDYLVQKTEPSFQIRRINQKIESFDKELTSYKQFFLSSDPECKNFINRLFEIDSGESISVDYLAYTHDYISDSKFPISPEGASKVKNNLQELFDFIQFQAGLNQLNLKFLPMSGGSQDYDNDSGTLYAKMVSQVSKLNKIFIKKKYEE
jgi:hypothetical protein